MLPKLRSLTLSLTCMYGIAATNLIPLPWQKISRLKCQIPVVLRTTGVWGAITGVGDEWV